MIALAERALADEEAFAGNLDAIEAACELERRRSLVAEGRSRLLTEDESWERVRAAGYDV